MDADKLMNGIIENITILIKKNKLTANDFAKKIGKRAGIVTDWKSGRSSPSLSDIATICEQFNCDLFDIIPEGIFSSREDKHSMDLYVDDGIIIENQKNDDTYRQNLRILNYLYSQLDPSDQEELLIIAKMKCDRTREKKEEAQKSSPSNTKETA